MIILFYTMLPSRLFFFWQNTGKNVKIYTHNSAGFIVVSNKVNCVNVASKAVVNYSFTVPMSLIYKCISKRNKPCKAIIYTDFRKVERLS